MTAVPKTVCRKAREFESRFLLWEGARVVEVAELLPRRAKAPQVRILLFPLDTHFVRALQCGS